MNDLEEAAQHWEELADAEDRMAQWEAKVFGPQHSVAPQLNRARLFRNTAKAIRMKAQDGIPRCACHLMTFEECREIRLRRQA